jgi:hypothetical protein
VLVLMTSSNLVGLSTGRSFGLVPRKSLPGIDAELAVGVGKAGAIAHQSPIRRILPDVEWHSETQERSSASVKINMPNVFR